MAVARPRAIPIIIVGLEDEIRILLHKLTTHGSQDFLLLLLPYVGADDKIAEPEFSRFSCWCGRLPARAINS